MAQLLHSSLQTGGQPTRLRALPLEAGKQVDQRELRHAHWAMRSGSLDGTTFVFKVSGPATDVPADASPPGLFTKGGSPTLTLITCGGDWDPVRGGQGLCA